MISVKRLLGLGFVTVLAACANKNNDDQISVASPVKPDDSIHAKVIYGDDDRRDLYQITDPKVLSLAKSTAALVQNAQLRPNGTSMVDIASTNFGEDYNLCPSEPFRDQDAAAFCSGFLVAPNIMVTAGHCIRSENECKKTTFVFDYAVTAQGEVGPRTTSVDNIYACKHLIKSQVVSRGADFAVVEIDRNVTGRQPLKLRRSGSLNPGDSITVIGHPAGIPTKVSGGAKVRKLDTGFFVANLDTYGGNSGSAVFNNTTGEVEGVLVRGETDFVFQGNCRISKVCDNDGCRGEDSTFISEVIPYINQARTNRSLTLGFNRRWRQSSY